MKNGSRFLLSLTRKRCMYIVNFTCVRYLRFITQNHVFVWHAIPVDSIGEQTNIRNDSMFTFYLSPSLYAAELRGSERKI